MQSWLDTLNQGSPTASAILTLAVVIAGGLVVGGVRSHGIRLGSAGVLFVGLIIGKFVQPLDHAVTGFLKDFGLVLFVFTIGLQLGPGFLASLRAEGLRLNLLAATIVVLGSLIAVIASLTLPIEPAGVIGSLTGAVTNTPSLGAAQQALKGLPAVAARVGEQPAIAYAVAYPGAIFGIIVSLILLRWLLKVDPLAEARLLEQDPSRQHVPFQRRTMRVDNHMLEGLEVGRIPGQRESGVTISRIRTGTDGEVRPVTAQTTVHLQDQLLAVGPIAALDQFQPAVGPTINEDLVDAPGRASVSHLVVTAPGVVGEYLRSLHLGDRYSVTITRVLRSGVEMSPDPGLRLHFGDVLYAVGEQEPLKQVADLVGNQRGELDQTHFAPIFLGIALGVLVGVIPIAIPGLSEPVRLGLAGGPLLIAILLGRLSSFGRLVWHMPEIANRSFRELGISLFLACVGLTAGPKFFATVLTGTGLLWVGLGLAMTMLPLLSVGWFARVVLRLNFLRISGLLAGSMTDPPALAFANSITGSEVPAIAYATVYPLTMLMRIVIAQVLVVVLCR